MPFHYKNHRKQHQITESICICTEIVEIMLWNENYFSFGYSANHCDLFERLRWYCIAKLRRLRYSCFYMDISVHNKANLDRIQDSGFRCLFNIITFQICLHIEHIVYLDLGSYQAFSSWWGWSTLNLKTVSWFTTDSVVNILPRVKKTGIILIKHHWLRLETSTKAL